MMADAILSDLKEKCVCDDVSTDSKLELVEYNTMQPEKQLNLKMHII